MTPERLAGWLRQKPAGSLKVQLTVDVPKPDGGRAIEMLADWDREDLDSGVITESDLAAQMLESAQEFTDADGEAHKFLVRWIGKSDRVLKTTTHRGKPRPTPADEQAGAADLADLLGGHLREAHKTVITLANNQATGIRSMQEAYEKTIAMQQEHVRELHALLRERDDSAHRLAAVAEREPTDEEREESLQRARAFEKLSERLPDVLDMVTFAVGKRFGLAAGEDDGGDGGDPAH